MDWDSLGATLQAACDRPQDEAAAERAVTAAEIVAAAAGEPPDELPADAREWVEAHGVPPEWLVELAFRSMKCVARNSEEWHARLNDLRFRLGDVVAG
jgi:hypothetical protein